MTPEELAARLDDLLREVRRQGKAAIAAQASADACLEAIGAMQPPEDDGAAPSDHAVAALVALVRALIPVADAVERIGRAAQAGDSLPRTWSDRLLGRPARDVSLATPLRLLQSQLESALESAGVRVDRRVGVPVEGEVHRVVETAGASRAGSDGESTVLSVVRPGYSLGGRCLREADVVASLPADSSPETSNKGRSRS